MRHFKRGRKLNRTASHRSALLSNLASSFIMHKQITTTQPKAKELRSFAERLITYAKKDSLHGRRLILKNIKGRLNKKIANILIHELAPNYKDRNGGYTRIIKLDNRKNDNAPMCIIEFVDLKLSEDDNKEQDIDKKDVE
jgi:large subunit ribosomal protein L17